MTVLQPANREALADFDLQRRSAQPGHAGEDASADRKRARQAWLHEMERAQLSNWFQPFAASPLATGPGMELSQRGAASRPAGPLSVERRTASAAHSVHLSMSSTANAREVALPASASAPLRIAVPPESAEDRAIGGSRSGASQRLADIETREAAAQSIGRESWNESESQPAAQEPMRSPGAVNRAAIQGEVLAVLSPPGEGMAGAVGGGSPVSQIAPQLPVNAEAKAANLFSGAPQITSLAPSIAAVTQTFSSWGNHQIAAEESTLFSSETPVRGALSDMPRVGDAARQTVQPGAVSASQWVGSRTVQQAATRLHANWTLDGLALWIGMDGTAQQVNAQAAVVVNTLQRTLRSQGHRLSRVVCNGSVVYDAVTVPSSASLFSDFSNFLDQRAAGHFNPGLLSFPSPKEKS